MADSAIKINIPDPDLSGVVQKYERTEDLLPSTPRQRVSINTVIPITLTDQWQNINFGNFSPLDMSTFPAPGRYDFVNLKFVANPTSQSEQLYYIKLYAKITHKQRPVTILYRYVVPRPVEEGGDFLFPLPGSDKYSIVGSADKKYTGGLAGNLLAIGNLSLTEDTNTYPMHFERFDPLPISQILKTYGARIQMRTLETIASAANRPKVTDCYAFILAQ
jgi:hypothetical protein